MSTEYLNLLNEKHENFKSITESDKRVIEEITFIESVIPEFFSKSGEAEGIKKMYKDIKVAMESPLFDKKINTVDINYAYHVYKEYVDGMIDFINDIKSIDEDANLKPFEEKFDIARSKDSDFIEFIYGGNINPVKETILTEATSNVEFLIDFIPAIKEMKSQCNALCESVGNDDNKKNQLLKESVNMLCESVDYFCYLTTKHIFESYDDIINSLNTETIPARNVPEFQLF